MYIKKYPNLPLLSTLTYKPEMVTLLTLQMGTISYLDKNFWGDLEIVWLTEVISTVGNAFTLKVFIIFITPQQN